MRSATEAACASCVTMITVWPNSSTASRSRASTSSEAWESRLPVGSSANTTAGRDASARATATRCCWPPESSEGRWREPVAEVDLGDQRVDPLAVGLAAGERERQQDVLLGGQHRHEVEGLEDEAELVAPQAREVAVVEVGELGPVDDDGARRRVVEPRQQVHQRGLAGAGRTHDGRELAGRERQRDPVQGVDRGFSLSVAAVQGIRGDDRGGVGARRNGSHA